MAVVYAHRKKTDDTVFYVGIGTRKYRATQTSPDRRSAWWRKTANKYGWYVEMIENNVSWEQACELEIFLIDMIGRRDKGKGSLVNHTDGGEGVVGRIVTEETKKKISISTIGKKMPNRKRIKLTDEHKNNISKTLYKPLYQLDTNACVINEFPNVLTAAKYIGADNSTIARACRDGYKSYNYFWRYKDDTRSRINTTARQLTINFLN